MISPVEVEDEDMVMVICDVSLLECNVEKEEGDSSVMACTSQITARAFEGTCKFQQIIDR